VGVPGDRLHLTVQVIGQIDSRPRVRITSSEHQYAYLATAEPSGALGPIAYTPPFVNLWIMQGNSMLGTGLISY
jgi:hypothetical protein